MQLFIKIYKHMYKIKNSVKNIIAKQNYNFLGGLTMSSKNKQNQNQQNNENQQNNQNKQNNQNQQNNQND